MKLTITPQMAKDWLEKSESNYRSLDAARIRNYSRSMREGRWVYNGESIKLNCNGSVVDGQHRLHAVVQTGVSIVSEVIEGITQIEDIDTGKPRRVSDVLRAMGEVNTPVLGSALKILYEYANRKSPDITNALSTSALLVFLKQCPSIRESVRFAVNGRHHFIEGGWSGVVHYCTHRADKELAKQFFLELISGENIADGDPTFALREYLLNVQSLPYYKRPDKLQKLAICTKAWNCYVADKPVSNLSFRRTGQKKEDFPRFAGFEEFTPE